MKLLLDIGNSRVKWALGGHAGDGGHGQRPLLQVDNRAHDGLPEAVLEQLAEARGADTFVAHVFGRDRDAALEAALRAAGAAAVRFAAPQAEHAGLRLAYAHPQRLGVDRYLAMQALWRETGGAFVVASAGTALTADVVDAGGRHLGGYIAPGLTLMRRAVLDGTRFEHNGDTQPHGRPGDSTESCVAEAALLACAGMLDACLQRHPFPAFLCGGDAATLLPHLQGEWNLRPHLVLQGLQQLD